MKQCTLQATLAMMICGLAAAHTGNAQLLEKRITVSLKEVYVEEALARLGEMTNIKFFFSVDQLEMKEKVSLDVRNLPLRDVLDQLFGPYNIKYQVHEGESSISLKKQKEKTGATPRVKRAENVTGRAALFRVTGIVTDASTQQGMAGVNVIVKGTTIGTTTDSEGKFAIEANERDILVFSFIGFLTYETALSGRSVIMVDLQEDITSLKEVEINAGYWGVKDKEQTGNISRVSAEEIGHQPVSNPLQAMQGRMPGVYIQQASGVPGSNFTVRIRGQNSIAGGNDPLYIIDGVPFISGSLSHDYTASQILGTGGLSPLNSFSPNDIESIEVLKDADATAIYGSRGANGVILITTKKGKAGQTKVDVNVYSGVGEVANKMDLLNTSQYLTMRREAQANDGLTPGGRDHDLNGNWDQTRYTDWQKVLLGGSAQTTNIQASISGGSEETQYLFSGTYQRMGTVFPGDSHQGRLSSLFSLNHRSADNRFKATFSMNYVMSDNSLLNLDLTGTALTLPPHAPALYDENGKLNWQNSSWLNPLTYLNSPYKEETKNLVTNAVLSYEITKDLVIKTNLGINDIRTSETNSTPSTWYNPAFHFTPEVSYITFNTADVSSWIIEPQVSWQKEISSGNLSIIAGTTFQDRKSTQLVQQASGFTSDALIEDIDAASLVDVIDYFDNTYKYSAAFARINFTWAGKYFINATGRRDGSSRFGPGKRFGNFGALGVAWIFSKEFNDGPSSLLSFGKLRASYGTSGNDQIGDYRYLDTYTSSQSYQGVGGLTPTRLYNNNFSWEVNRKMEAGLDLGFFDDRLFLSLGYFRNRSSNQLISYALPVMTGFNGIQSNLPATVQNSGMEVELNTVNITTRSFSWSSAVNFTLPRNKLVDFPGLEQSSYRSTYVVGEPITIVRTYHYLGINPETGEYDVADMDKDGFLTEEDMGSIVQRTQKFYGGFSNTLKYKGIQLDFFFQFVSQIGSNYREAAAWPGQANLNMPVEVLDNHWQQPGNEAVIPRYFASYNSSIGNFLYSDAFWGDASFVRLKNVALSCSLPKRWTKKAGIRIYVQGQNLLTFTDYYGLDPETTNSNSLPPLRTLTAGIQATF